MTPEDPNLSFSRYLHRLYGLFKTAITSGLIDRFQPNWSSNVLKGLGFDKLTEFLNQSIFIPRRRPYLHIAD